MPLTSLAVFAYVKLGSSVAASHACSDQHPPGSESSRRWASIHFITGLTSVWARFGASERFVREVDQAMTTVAKHLSHAKRDIAQGTASFRSAANHIAAAIKAGATQAEVAGKVGKSQPWVNRLLKWREGGFKEGSPFAADHAHAIISAANNPEPAQRIVDVNVTYETASSGCTLSAA